MAKTKTNTAKPCEKQEFYENYPKSMVLIANAFHLAIYLLGVYLLWPYGYPAVIPYLLLCAFVHVRTMVGGCVNCYYYGKLCFSGQGALAAKLFKKGDPKKFTELPASWIIVLPDFMVSILPIIVGVIRLVGSFDWAVLAAIAALSLLMTVGNAVIHLSMACKYCKQRELGCPACELFGGKDKKK